jgi:hypothetical protein
MLRISIANKKQPNFRKAALERRRPIFRTLISLGEGFLAPIWQNDNEL